MKKFVSFLFIFLFAISFSGCGVLGDKNLPDNLGPKENVDDLSVVTSVSIKEKLAKQSNIKNVYITLNIKTLLLFLLQ